MQKIITFRANEEDLKMINELKTYYEKLWKDAGIYRQVTTTDIIFQAIVHDWENNCYFKQNNR